MISTYTHNYTLHSSQSCSWWCTRTLFSSTPKARPKFQTKPLFTSMQSFLLLSDIRLIFFFTVNSAFSHSGTNSLATSGLNSAVIWIEPNIFKIKGWFGFQVFLQLPWQHDIINQPLPMNDKLELIAVDFLGPAEALTGSFHHCFSRQISFLFLLVGSGVWHFSTQGNVPTPLPGHNFCLSFVLVNATFDVYNLCIFYRIY